MTHTTGHPARTRTRLLLAGLTSAALAAITGVISYNHGLDVVRLVGNTGTVAYLVPLVPDLMIVTSSLTLIEASALRVARPAMAIVALLAGIGWTVAVNVAAGWRGGPGGALIAAGIPLAFGVPLESLLWLVRRGRGGDARSDAPPCPHGAADTAEGVAVLAFEHARDCAHNPLSQRALAEITVPSRARIGELVRMAAGEVPAPSLNGAGADAG